MGIKGHELEDPIKRKELFKDPGNVQKLLEWLMHACDIANSAKPWKTCQAWATAVTEEFFQQGEKEKATGLPVSPMMDRASTAIPQMQCGFIEFVVAPLFCEPDPDTSGDSLSRLQLVPQPQTVGL